MRGEVDGVLSRRGAGGSFTYDGPVTPPTDPARTVAVVTLGCARNVVDSEELAGRLAAGGYRLVEDVLATMRGGG